MADSKYPLNQILYGPPGTGKTYQTINKALEILGFKDYEAIKNELERLGKSIDGDGRTRAKALFDHYQPRRKAPSFSYGDIRLAQAVCANICV
ncbi:P-loop NTPase family protein, partial [Helicobacter bizzozeronii]